MACSGVEALEKLNSEQEFHLVVCDVMMPNMNGLELLPKIRQSGKAYSNIPVISALCAPLLLMRRRS